MKKIFLWTIWVVIFLLITGRVLSYTRYLFSKEINSNWEDSTRRAYKVSQAIEIKEGPVIVVNEGTYLYSYFLEDIPVVRGRLDPAVLDKLVKKYKAKYLLVTLKKEKEIGTIYVGEKKLSPSSIIDDQEFKVISFDLSVP